MLLTKVIAHLNQESVLIKVIVIAISIRGPVAVTQGHGKLPIDSKIQIDVEGVLDEITVNQVRLGISVIGDSNRRQNLFE